jgi:nucleotide-binding universal stress UspA family protein
VSPHPIIGAIDVFARSASAARCAGWLAETSSSPLLLVYVLDTGSLPALPRMDPVMRRRLYRRQEANARALGLEELNAIAADLPGVSSSAMVLEGDPIGTLHELAVDQDAALLVAGTAARAGLEHVLQGSVSGRLAAASPCPVVVVPLEADVGEEGPVLVGDDGSDDGHRAMRHATSIAERLRRDVVRMHVEEGDPVTVLRDAGQRRRASLLVTGTRGRGPVRAELFGSVSTGLTEKAGRPVVLVSSAAGEPVWVGG